VEGKKDMVVYVKLDDFQDVVDITNLIRTKLKEARFIISKITELKKQEDAEIDHWAAELESVEEKIGMMDRTLSEPGV